MVFRHFLGLCCLLGASSSLASSDTASLYKLKLTTLERQEIPTESFKGKVMLVVNTASQCGHTDQLGGLQSLYEKYKDQGLVVLGFPSNDFRQENLEGEAIANFCKRNYGVSFPMFQKTSVNGPERHPLYVHLVTNSTTPSENIKWNFEKFLVNREGKVIGRYESKVKPDDKKLLSDIESALGTKKSPTL